MSDLLPRLKKAKTDNIELNKLIHDYMPYIKKEVLKTPIFQMEFDDRLSIAMLVFMNCVRQYDENNGGFFPFVSICIRNRLIDEGKKLARYQEKVVPFRSSSENDSLENTESAITSQLAYKKEQERLSLSEEIDLLSQALMKVNIAFDSLADICPKQNRSRKQCTMLANEIISNPALREPFLRSYRIPQAELARHFGISEKTIEKHRRYIVTIAIIISGDYPGIQAFLPKGGGQSENWNYI